MHCKFVNLIPVAKNLHMLSLWRRPIYYSYVILGIIIVKKFNDLFPSSRDFHDVVVGK